jgi:type VI secretion system lysozyme-like protein
MIVAKRSLFYRFDETLEDVYINEGDYIHEIMHDVSLLLNTRCVVPVSVQNSSILPLNYGLPYLFGFREVQDYANTDEQKQWSVMLEETITFFEPRLKNPHVIIAAFNTKSQSLDLDVQGTIALKGIHKKVSFPIYIRTEY